MKRFEENKAGKDYAVGDIHGCFSKLKVLLAEIGFNTETDRLFSVGDLVDRGPESHEALEWLDQPWFHAVKGNHEVMAVDYAAGRIDDYMYAVNGGAWFMGMTPAERQRYVDAFKDLPVAMEVETAAGKVGIVHGECPVADWNNLDVALTGEHGEAFENIVLWSRERITTGLRDEVQNVRAVICGHTPLREKTVLGNVHYIDTAAVFQGGKLTILDLATLKEAP